MSINISMQQARDLAQMAIEERGADFIYQRGTETLLNLWTGEPEEVKGDCFYFHDDGPGCIVGYILDRLGVDSEGYIESDINNLSVSQLRDEELIVCDEDTLKYLTTMQEGQDEGETWANAYLEAENALGFPAAVEMIEARPLPVEVPTDAA